MTFLDIQYLILPVGDRIKPHAAASPRLSKSLFLRAT